MRDNETTITVLGSGTSHGVPMIACDCPVCTSDDLRDKRTRPSILIERGETALLVDTTPELRMQCLANDVRRIDAVLYTHFHVDHVAGLDDLRRFSAISRRDVPCYGQAATFDRIRSMFPYVFDPAGTHPSAIPRLALHEIDGPFEVGGVKVTPIPLLHGSLEVLGFRVGRFAYCTDVSEIPAKSWRLLEGLEVLILDALRLKPHPTHFNLEAAVDHARRIGARRTLFTHIAHEMGHERTNATLPEGMALAFDGQRIVCS